MKVGILGSGSVAQALAAGFVKYGYHVKLGTRTPGKLADWLGQHAGVQVGSVADAAEFGEVLVLAVKGDAAVDVLKAAGANKLRDKVVLDTCNPIKDAPPANGVLQMFTDINESLMEQLQHKFADVKFVKAFSCVGAGLMVDPQLKGGKPTMFICGNDDAAKKVTTGILDDFGWETADMGKVESARAIEPLCMLWCLPGFLNSDWNHAFKVLRLTE